MYVQGVENVYDLNFNGREGAEQVTYGDVFLQTEQEYSRHNFEHADTATCCCAISRTRKPSAGAARRRADADGKRHRHGAARPMTSASRPAHSFNLLDARGVISVTERQSYILRVRELAKACGAAWLKTEAGGAG